MVRSRERVGWLCKQNLRLRQFWNSLKYFRPRKEGREFRIILTKQEGRESKSKRKGSKIKGNKYGRGPVSE